MGAVRVVATTPAPPAGHVPGGRRLLGGAATGTAAAVVAENAVLAASGAPTFGAPMAEVLDYYAAHRGAVAVATALVALYLPLLLVVLTGLRDLLGAHAAGARWSRLAVASGAAFAGGTVLVNVLQVAVVLSAQQGRGPSPASEIVWSAHAAAFALTLPLLGGSVLGAALAAHAGGLTRPWQRVLGVAAAALLVIAGAGAVAVADGSPMVAVGLLGLAGWLGWLLTTGVRLIRRVR